jgi:hypothetical protein
MTLTSFFSGDDQPTANLQEIDFPTNQPGLQTPALSGSPISLGDFDFDDDPLGASVPTFIESGMSQRLNVHKLMGGGVVIDAMGGDYDEVKWSGTFFGPDAMSRGQQLAQMAYDGQSHTLVWGPNAFDVVVAAVPIKDFYGYSEYSITCHVLDVQADNNSDTLSQVVSEDMDSADDSLPDDSDDLSDGIDDATDAISQNTVAINPITNAIRTSTQIANNFLSTIGPVKDQITSRLTQANTLIHGIGTLGATGNPALTIRNLNSATSALENIAKLSTAQAYIGRAINNVTSTGIF